MIRVAKYPKKGLMPLPHESNWGAQRRDVLLLQTTKVLRSLGQGALLVTFAIYLDSLGWSAAAIGSLLAAGGLLHSLLSLPVGIASDRVGRKIFVVANEVGLLGAAVAALLTANPWILGAASIVGAFGRGQVGMVGPAAPAEQAWISELIPAAFRGRIFSTNASLGFIGTGLGSIIAAMMPSWEHLLPGSLAYRPFFALIVVTSAVNLLLLARIHDSRAGTERATRRRSADRDVSAAASILRSGTPLTQKERTILAKMGAINAMNGLAIGLTSPLLAYWFNVRFGVGPGSIGTVFAITYFVTALASSLTGRAADRSGIVRSVVTVRLLAVGILTIIPLVPWFWLAAALYVVRSALSRGTQGARQALAVGLVSEERRGLASSINNISNSLPNALGPMAAGVLLGAGFLTIPFYFAAALQFGYGVLFGRVFREYDKPSQPDAARSRGTAVK